MPFRSLSKKEINWQYWLIAVSIALLVITIRVSIGNNLPLGSIIVSVIAACLIGLIIASFLLEMLTHHGKGT